MELALLVPVENYLQRRDVDLWGVDTLGAPSHRVLRARSAARVDEAGFFARTPLVRAVARLDPQRGFDRWVRSGSHRVYSSRAHPIGAALTMEVSPDLVIRHLPYASRSALDARLRFRGLDDGKLNDNRSEQVVKWESVSTPVNPSDPYLVPAVRTVQDDAFARIRSRFESTGLSVILADAELAGQRHAIQPSDADVVFAEAADLLTATIRPRDDG